MVPGLNFFDFGWETECIVDNVIGGRKVGGYENRHALIAHSLSFIFQPCAIYMWQGGVHAMQRADLSLLP
jgi:hypothetical protein